jgi:RimJ/RimL family protein N-acetyltransferase
VAFAAEHAEPIEAGRLLLEPLRPEHAAEMAPLLDDPALYVFTGGEPASAAELGERYERQARGRSPDGRELWLNWIVRERAGGRAVGYVQATVEPAGGAAEVAWVVGTGFQGRGYAREAAGAMVAWLRGHGAAVTAYVHPDHAASQSVARAVGLEPTAVGRDGEVRWA